MVPAHPGSPGKRAVKRVLNGVGLLFFCLKFLVAPLGSPGSRWPRFIEPPELPVSTPLHGAILRAIDLIDSDKISRSIDIIDHAM